MIPGRYLAKYKFLPRIQLDVWNTLQTKHLKKKKWRPLLRRIKYKKKIPPLCSPAVRPLSKFPVYHKYYFKNTFYIKQGLKLFYGALQDYRIKALAQRAKKQGSNQFFFLREFDIQLASFLYNLKITHTLGEARQHCVSKRVYVNQSNTQKQIKKGDILHFSPFLQKIVLRRFQQKHLKYLPFEMDFDAQSLRFIVLQEKKVFTHPLMHKFKRVMRTYTL